MIRRLAPDPYSKAKPVWGEQKPTEGVPFCNPSTIPPGLSRSGSRRALAQLPLKSAIPQPSPPGGLPPGSRAAPA